MTTRLVCLVAVVVLLAGSAHAQSVDIAGVRARGMGGAFTAVADDASATWWNPAGLAAGPYVNALVEFDSGDEPGSPSAGRTPARVGAIAVAIPALGVSYYHFRISEIRGSRATGTSATSRQDLGPAGAGVFAGDQVGGTVGQSLGDHLVVATTLKLVHGGPDGGATSTSGTLDLGAIASFGVARFGLAARNVTEPTLGANPTFTIARQVRAGAAVMLAGRGAVDGVTLSADADIATRPLVSGDEREVAAGAEVWLAKRRIGLRGGLSGETVGDVRPAASAGFSLALKSGVFVELSGTGGGDLARRGWAAGARVTF